MRKQSFHMYIVSQHCNSFGVALVWLVEFISQVSIGQRIPKRSLNGKCMILVLTSTSERIRFVTLELWIL
jgi:hypothetical protein